MNYLENSCFQLIELVRAEQLVRSRVKPLISPLWDYCQLLPEVTRCTCMLTHANILEFNIQPLDLTFGENTLGIFTLWFGLVRCPRIFCLTFLTEACWQVDLVNNKLSCCIRFQQQFITALPGSFPTCQERPLDAFPKVSYYVDFREAYQGITKMITTLGLNISPRTSRNNKRTDNVNQFLNCFRIASLLFPSSFLSTMVAILFWSYSQATCLLFLSWL